MIRALYAAKQDHFLDSRHSNAGYAPGRIYLHRTRLTVMPRSREMFVSHLQLQRLGFEHLHGGAVAQDL